MKIVMPGTCQFVPDMAKKVSHVRKNKMTTLVELCKIYRCSVKLIYAKSKWMSAAFYLFQMYTVLITILNWQGRAFTALSVVTRNWIWRSAWWISKQIRVPLSADESCANRWSNIHLCLIVIKCLWRENVWTVPWVILRLKWNIIRYPFIVKTFMKIFMHM